MKLSLEPEFVDIRGRVDEVLAKVDSDVARRGVFFGGIAVEAKGRQVPALLKKECLRLVESHHSGKDVKEIESFIRAERNRVTATFSKHAFELPRYDEFDARIDDLVALMSNRAVHMRKMQKRIPKWVIDFIIAVVAGITIVMLGPIIAPIILSLLEWLKNIL
jgi:hypothetical protein